jgi:hypothetical protein
VLIEGKGFDKTWTFSEGRRSAVVKRCAVASSKHRRPVHSLYSVTLFRNGKRKDAEALLTKLNARRAAYEWLRGGRPLALATEEVNRTNGFRSSVFADFLRLPAKAWSYLVERATKREEEEDEAGE